MDIQTANSAAVAGGFLHLRSYESKTSGEIAHYTVNGKVSYLSLLERSAIVLAEMTAETVFANCGVQGVDLETCRKALAEQSASYEKSISRIAAGGGSTDYNYVQDGLARLASDPQGDLYLWGLIVSKDTVQRGVYKAVTSADKTLVKRWIQRQAPASKFRRFKLTAGSYEYVSIGGERVG